MELALTESPKQPRLCAIPSHRISCHVCTQGLTRRTTSLERQQLSPSLMQHIQRVQQKPTATNRSREPAGWGMGSPSAATSAAQVS